MLGADARVFSGRTFWFLLALVVITVLVYAPVRNHEFVAYDDNTYVTDNPHVKGGLTWSAVIWAFTTGYANFWHPLTWLSIMLDVQWYGLNAGLHHTTSVLLHVVGTLLLFLVLLRMTGAQGRSLFVAALFAIHPLHVESVAWIAERKDVLSTVFWMLTLWFYVGYVRNRRWPQYILSLTCFALGLMAKPMLVTLPFALLLLDAWPLARLPGADVYGKTNAAKPSRLAAFLRTWNPLVREKVPFIVLAAAVESR
jgi:protein O-mannosyl-transferase